MGNGEVIGGMGVRGRIFCAVPAYLAGVAILEECGDEELASGAEARACLAGLWHGDLRLKPWATSRALNETGRSILLYGAGAMA